MADICDLVSLATQIKKLYSAACRSVCVKYGLTQTEFEILEYLSSGGSGDTAAEISRERLIKKANVSTAVNRLISKDLLIRSHDSRDRRIIHLELTEKAESTVSEILNAKEEFSKRISEYVDERELKSFALIAEKLIASELKLCESM